MSLSTLFSGIADAIRAQDGTSEPIVANDFPARIQAIPSGGGAPGTPLDPVQVYNATRPADWLPMPEPQDNEMYLLFHIPDGVSSLLAFTVTCTGSYTVALGTVSNGAFVQASSVSVASGAKYEAELFADDYGDLTADGMKQVMVKVSGTDILTWEPSTHSKKTAPSNFCNWNIVEIVCKLPSGTKVACGNLSSGKALNQLRYFSWSGENGVTEMGSMFRSCHSLIAIMQLNTSRVKNMTYMFCDCYSLTAIPQLDTSLVTNMVAMFFNCHCLKSLPALKTSGVNRMGAMFYNCYSLLAIPELSTSFVADMNSMFYSCYCLASIPVLNILRASDMVDIFKNCYNLGFVLFAPSPPRTIPSNLISLENCSLSHQALVNMFTSLPKARTSATINLTGNPGVSELTDEEKAIATGKNWTLTL